MSIVVMGARRSGRTTLLKSIAAANQFDLVLDDLTHYPDAKPEGTFLVSICGGPEQVPAAFRNAVFIPLPSPNAIRIPVPLPDVVPVAAVRDNAE